MNKGMGGVFKDVLVVGAMLKDLRMHDPVVLDVTDERYHFYYEYTAVVACVENPNIN